MATKKEHEQGEIIQYLKEKYQDLKSAKIIEHHEYWVKVEIELIGEETSATITVWREEMRQAKKEAQSNGYWTITMVDGTEIKTYTEED